MRKVVRKQITEPAFISECGDDYPAYTYDVLHVFVDDVLVFKGTEGEANYCTLARSSWLPVEAPPRKMADAILYFFENCVFRTNGVVSVSRDEMIPGCNDISMKVQSSKELIEKIGSIYEPTEYIELMSGYLNGQEVVLYDSWCASFCIPGDMEFKTRKVLI